MQGGKGGMDGNRPTIGLMAVGRSMKGCVITLEDVVIDTGRYHVWCKYSNEPYDIVIRQYYG